MESRLEHWWHGLSQRERDEVMFAYLYAKGFDHGTPGHQHLKIIASMIDLLGSELKDLFHQDLQAQLNSIIHG